MVDCNGHMTPSKLLVRGIIEDITAQVMSPMKEIVPAIYRVYTAPVFIHESAHGLDAATMSWLLFTVWKTTLILISRKMSRSDVQNGYLENNR